MFERFTDRARLVVVQAQEEARRLAHDQVGPEHILLGLIDDEVGGVAGRALESLGIGLQDLRQRLEDIIGRGEHAPSGRIPFSPAAREVLPLALEESRSLGHRYIGTEHILLGLLREGDSVGARVLADLGVSLDAAREEIIRLLAEFRRAHGTG
jgi:ATP-dependent Clp protease ATP-binding subunit ClpC